MDKTPSKKTEIHNKLQSLFEDLFENKALL